MNEDLTALIGVNGAGKSTILKAILLLKKLNYGHPLRQSDSKKSNKCQIDVSLTYNGKPVSLKSTIYFNTDDENDDEVEASELIWNFESLTGYKGEIPIQRDYIYYNSLRSSHGKGQMIFYRGTRDNIVDTKYFQEALPYAQEILKHFQEARYYSASQFSNPRSFPNYIELDEENEYKSWRNSGTSGKVLYDLYNSFSSKSNEYSQFVNIIGPNGLHLVDSVGWEKIKMPAVSYEVRSGGYTSIKKQNRWLIVPVFKVGNNTLSANQLSEGTLRTLSLFYYIINDSSNLLFIEEPEVCVHHGLLTSLISLIKEQSKKKQIVISTHSDYVLDELTPENVVFISKDSESGTQARKLTDSLPKKEISILKKYLAESGNLGEYWREGGFDDVK
jgi:AAA15 family ATPase/GTPase